MGDIIDWAGLEALTAQFADAAAGREQGLDSAAVQVEALRAAGVWDADLSALGAVDAVETVAAGDLAPALLLAQHQAALAWLGASGSADLVAFRSESIEQRINLAALTEGGSGFDASLVDAVVWHDAAFPLGGPGVDVAPFHDPLGLRRAAPFRISLHDAVPAVGGAPVDAVPAWALGELLVAAAVLGASRGSVEAATVLTRERRIPRPVPGVTSPTEDPLSQVVLGAALVPIDGARALVRDVAADVDRVLQDGWDDARSPDWLRRRVFAALDVALAAGLEQGEQVYEVVGTSGSGNRHGFDRLWRDVRTLSLEFDLRGRRRELGRDLAGVGA